MKKFKSAFMFCSVVIALAAVFCFNASAAEWTDYAIKYTFDEDTGVMVVRSGETSVISTHRFGIHCEYCSLEECDCEFSYDDYDGDELEAAINKAAKATKTLIIEEGITAIEDGALSFFVNAETIILPQSVTVLPDGLCYNLEKLRNIVVSSSLTKIGDDAFSGCTNLKNLYIPDSVKVIGDSAFHGCMKNSVRLPENIENKGNSLFSSSIKELEVIDKSYHSFTFRVWFYEGSASEFDGIVAYEYNKKNNQYKKLTESKDNKKFVVDKLKEGEEYNLAFRTYTLVNGEKIYGDYTYITVKTLPYVPDKAKNLQVVYKKNNEVYLHWSGEATGYRIYQYNKKTKKYTKVKTLKGVTYHIISGLDAGKEYGFLVRAYNKLPDGTTKWAPYTSKDVFYVTTHFTSAKPSLKLSSTSKGKVTATWKDISGETGYQVYYSTNSYFDGQKKIGNFNANTTKISKTGLKSGKRYYFRVRAYKKIDTGYAYSDWSLPVSIKVK